MFNHKRLRRFLKVIKSENTFWRSPRKKLQSNIGFVGSQGDWSNWSSVTVLSNESLYGRLTNNERIPVKLT